MIGNKVRIQVPVELQRRAAKLLNSPKYKAECQLKSQPLLIKCPYHPHRLNQVYPSNIPLSSSTWTGRKSIGRSFTFLPISPGKPHSDKDFLSLGLHPSLASVLKAQDFKTPTNIQALAIPQILKGESDILIASETGNGKTLSFLLPILHGLISNPVSEDLPFNSPRAIIIAPGRELALQIHRIAKSLADDLGLRSHCILGGSVKRTAVIGERANIDILVSTMGALNKYLSNGYVNSNLVRYLVFDEADTLLDDTFSRITSHIIASIHRSRKGSCQLIFSGATMAKHIANFGSVMDVEGIKRITTNSLHRIPINIRQKFIRTSMTGKFPVLVEQIEKDVLKKRRTLVFVNKSASSIWMKHALVKENIPALSFCQHVPYKNRHEQIDRFLNEDDEANVLIATDLASRGLDFDASLHHVVNFDFPFNMSDYIHRIGRVGRVSSEPIIGRVTNFACTPLDMDLVQKIEKALRQNTLLPNVNSNIIRIIQKKHQEMVKNREINEAIQEEAYRKIVGDMQE